MGYLPFPLSAFSKDYMRITEGTPFPIEAEYNSWRLFVYGHTEEAEEIPQGEPMTPPITAIPPDNFAILFLN